MKTNFGDSVALSKQCCRIQWINSYEAILLPTERLGPAPRDTCQFPSKIIWFSLLISNFKRQRFRQKLGLEGARCYKWEMWKLGACCIKFLSSMYTVVLRSLFYLFCKQRIEEGITVFLFILFANIYFIFVNNLLLIYRYYLISLYSLILFTEILFYFPTVNSGVPRGFGRFSPPPPEIPKFWQAQPNSQFCG
jgi:hypothetical protein